MGPHARRFNCDGQKHFDSESLSIACFVQYTLFCQRSQRDKVNMHMLGNGFEGKLSLAVAHDCVYGTRYECVCKKAPVRESVDA